MSFLIYLIAFFIIRSGFRSTGSGSFAASLILFVGVMCAYSGMWFYAVAISGLAFVIAGATGPRRRAAQSYSGYDPYDDFRQF